MPHGRPELTGVEKDERPAPDALLRLTSLLMQGQIRPHGNDSVAIAAVAPRRLTLPGFRACCRGNKAGNPVTVLEA